MSQLALYLLGSFRAEVSGEAITAFESDKVRALLAYLAVEAERPHRREKLVGLLWPDWPEASARQNLSHALYNLRDVIGDREAERPILSVTRQTLQFGPDGDAWVDAAVFRDLIAQCRRHDHPRLEACDACMERLRQATGLFGASFLEGFSLPDSGPFEEWAGATRQELQRQVLEALHSLSACYEAHGELEAALEPARRAVELDPCWEEGERDLIRLLALNGQAIAAVAQCEAFERLLGEELGVAPSQETQALHQLLLEGRRPAPIPSAAAIPERKPRPVGACPYRGLATFREDDAPFFYGREAFVERLVDAVERRPVVAVIVGSSGSGKSSAVFAGLLPRLRSEPGWLVAQLRPGGRPFEATAAALLPLLEPGMTRTDRLIETQKLGEALREGQVGLLDVAGEVLDQAPDAHRLLLVVDQFEELYTLCPDPALQRSFVDKLLAAVESGGKRRASPLALLLTLRADFMGQALAHRPFADALQDGSLIMGPMTRDELREAIERPAEAQGAAFEAGLVDRILDDVGNEPGNLPLLEFALTLLWENHEHGWLTHAGYEGIGRVEGALARYADQVYGELDAGEREQARRILIQLVRPGEGTEDTRRVASRAELGDENWELVGHLADRRLVVTGRDRATGQEAVEVVHEALIQRWGRMRGWMDEDRAFRTWQERLRAALRGWEASGRDEGALLRGAPLAEAENWLAERAGELGRAERDYVDASAALRDRQQAEGERRRRVTMAALAGGLVVAAILAAIALVARHQATTAAADAVAGREAAEVEADARATAEAVALVEREEARRQASVGLAAQALAELDGASPDRAVLLALEALEHYPYTPQAESALARVMLEYVPPIYHNFFQAAWSPDGGRLAIRDSWFGTVLKIIDTDTDVELERITVAKDYDCVPYEIVWSPAGDRLAVTSFVYVENAACPTGTVWDLETRALLFTLPPELGYFTNAAWLPDGRGLLTGGDDGVLRIWNLETGVEQLALAAHTERIEGIAFSPAGDLLATASADATARVWDVATLLALGQGGELALGAESVAPLFILSGHVGGVTGVSWAPDGVRLVTSSQDGTARIWSIPKAAEATGEMLLALTGHQGAVLSAAWSPDGRHIGTLGEDSTARMWDAVTGMELFREPCDLWYIPTPKVAWTPAGELACISVDSSNIWDISETTGQLVGHTDMVRGARWSPDGTRIATSSFDGTIRVWDGTTFEELLVIERPGMFVYNNWSPDGTRIATGSMQGPVQVWDATTGELLVEVPGIPGYASTHVGWSADGSRIAVTTLPGIATRVFDAATGEILLTIDGPDCMHLDPDWSPVGDYFVGGCYYTNEGFYLDGRTPARIWDGTSGELLLTLPSKDGWTVKGVWSPDGERLAVAHVGEAEGSGGTVVVWRILSNSSGHGLTGEELLTFTGHASEVGDLVWSPDGSRIASGDGSGIVKVWDAASGEDVCAYQVPSTVLNLDWSPDGSHLVVAGTFPTPLVFRVWPSTEELIDHAYDCCVTRQLTAEERVQFGLPPAEEGD